MKGSKPTSFQNNWWDKFWFLITMNLLKGKQKVWKKFPSILFYLLKKIFQSFEITKVTFWHKNESFLDKSEDTF